MLAYICTAFFILATHVAAGPPSPTAISCPPNNQLVRSAGPVDGQRLSSQEQDYISTRAAKVLPKAFSTYLHNAKTASSKEDRRTETPEKRRSRNLSDKELPRLGIALSGGGYRAALFGAAVLSSLDGRNETAVKVTGTGGLLQAASYISGLSGGSWLLTSLIQSNFPTIADLIFPPASQANSALGNAAFGGWLTGTDLTAPGPTANDSLVFLQGLLTELAQKNASGFPITITDLWSRGLARHFVNGTTAANILQPGVHGAGVLLSDVAKLPTFVNHQQPFPIVVADSIPPNPGADKIIPGDVIPLKSEIWEFNVFESGSFDPTLASFIPTSLLGSSNSSCVAGFDQAAFIAGISSSLFNEFNGAFSGSVPSPTGELISLVAAAFGNPHGVRLDSAAVPNPFKGINPQSFTNANQDMVQLCDGGLDGEVLPLQPLLVRARGIDTILAIDAPADTDINFTNGTDLINARKRAGLFGDAYPFPPIPSMPEIFIALNLTRRPTFFGCNINDGVTPLIIYIANGGPPADGAAPVTNTPTAKTTYSDAEVQAFLDQAFDIATQGIPGTDWGTCLSCAVYDRVRARRKETRDAVCNDCMKRYCWNAG
ncbi:lysophospholipase [Hysterangium stoloniferum]|nr:lysophospholipase [Hysterangium stoloniferum]